MSIRPMIIVAEPEEAIRDSIEMILLDEGYNCHAVADFQALLQAIHLHHCDLIITDIVCIYRNMESVLLALQTYSTSPPPILITLYYQQTCNMLPLKKSKVTEYLIKPFSFDELLERIFKMIGSKIKK
ncbi:MAG TPA: response regulator [Fodinibius sp.]|nr:response regulator [Fodinibius sp.]